MIMMSMLFQEMDMDKNGCNFVHQCICIAYTPHGEKEKMKIIEHEVKNDTVSS